MKADFTFKQSYKMNDLLTIMAILRGENGCNWDREQNHATIRNNLIEECYEVVDAIDRQSADMLCEELGDVLLQIVFHARIEQEQGSFDFDSVCDGICKKLIHRHPHVFGDVVVADSTEVLSNWDKIKKAEKGQTTAASSLEAVPKAFPALMRAQKVQKRAAKTGFDYPALSDAFADAESELDELRRAVSGDGDIAEEIGDLLFSAVNVSRLLGIDAEEALQRSSDKFTARFTNVEQQASREGIELSSCDFQTMDKLWKKAKQ